MKKLVGDVGENGGAAKGDAAFGHQDQQAGQEFAKTLGRREFEAAAKEVCGQVGGVIAGSGWEGDGGVAQAKMMRAEAGLGFQAGLAALLAIGIAMLAAGANRRGP